MTRLYYTLLLLLAAATMVGQEHSIKASIDSTKIRIGSQFNLTLKTTVDKHARVSFPQGKDFGQLEVLEAYPTDTILKNGLYELVKKYGLTQFDTGRYEIPRLPVIINNKTFQTNPLTIEVRTVVVDTLKQKMYDIKPVLAAESRSWLWLYILIGIVLLVGVGYLVYYYIKHRKPAPGISAEEEHIAPIEKAMTGLSILEQKGLISKGEVKEYYSELVNIARTYLEGAMRIPAMESTTGQLITTLQEAAARKNMALEGSVYEELEKVLRNADMAKFALSRPDDTVIIEDRARIEHIITTIEKNLPEEVEVVEPTEEEIAKQQELLQIKKKQKRVAIQLTVGVLVILGAIAYIKFTKGSNYLKDNIFGHPTKELLDGEWVKSDYGVPGITLETPKVLKRIKNTDGYSYKDTAKDITEIQVFEYGSLFDNFHIAVATTLFKQHVDIDLSKAFDTTAKIWEGKGATGILQKQEDFANGHGTEGVRVYGTMFLPDPETKEKKRVYYEIFYFGQQQGLQQVVILHEDGDPYAKGIEDRIKNSVEFKVIKQQ